MFSIVRHSAFRGLISLTVVVATLAILAANPPSSTQAFAITIWVNSANDATDAQGCDDTHCSLREAITKANTNGVDTIIAFTLDNCPPSCTISPQTNLPSVLADSTVIDGTTEPEYDGTPIVAIDGSALGGLALSA